MKGEADPACAWERYLIEKQRTKKRDGVLGALGLCFLVLVIVSLMSARAWGGTPALGCEAIKDPDRRHLCRATTGDLPTECEFIRSRDLRAECRVILAARKK